jgi:hypothetical protein
MEIALAVLVTRFAGVAAAALIGRGSRDEPAAISPPDTSIEGESPSALANNDAL